MCAALCVGEVVLTLLLDCAVMMYCESLFFSTDSSFWVLIGLDCANEVLVSGVDNCLLSGKNEFKPKSKIQRIFCKVAQQSTRKARLAHIVSSPSYLRSIFDYTNQIVQHVHYSTGVNSHQSIVVLEFNLTTRRHRCVRLASAGLKKWPQYIQEVSWIQRNSCGTWTWHSPALIWERFVIQ